ncbi:MAG: RHS repeat-associated protein [Flavobacteriaceae bacterium]|jgi:RHS repeat-associated protein
MKLSIDITVPCAIFEYQGHGLSTDVVQDQARLESPMERLPEDNSTLIEPSSEYIELVKQLESIDWISDTASVNKIGLYSLQYVEFQEFSTHPFYTIPYGMVMPNRHEADDSYRYSFQGQEHDDEVKGEGNSINYKYRMHDPRVGRFFCIDPLSPIYPHNSTYAFSENVVINSVELEGLERQGITSGLEALFNWWTDATAAPVAVAKQTQAEIKRGVINTVKAAYPEGGTAQHFIEHYGYGNSTTVVMTEKEMKEVFPRSDWDGNQLQIGLTNAKFKELGLHLFGGSRDYKKEDIEAYAATGGTLGRTYVDIEGYVSEELFGGSKTLVFRGTVTFYDKWNFDKSKDRKPIANILTGMGRTFLPGDSFEIIGTIDVIQYEGGPLEFVSGGIAAGKPGLDEKTQEDNMTDSDGINEVQH